MLKNYFDILERKNLCFRNFRNLCEIFLDQISKGNLDEILEFQRKRQSLIHVLEELEVRANEVLSGLDAVPGQLDILMTDTNKLALEALLTEKDSIVHSILDLDLQILKHIDKLKDETIQTLHSLQSNKKTVSRYKSPLHDVEAAEGITRSLDEKA